MRRLFVGILGFTVVSIGLVYLINSQKSQENTNLKKKKKTLIAKTDKTKKIVSFKGKSMEEAKAEVAKKDKEGDNKELLAAFEAEGWSKAENVKAPKEDLIGLNPELLESNEEELQVQMGSNIHGKEALGNLYKIAVKSENLKTRYLAIEAIGDNVAPEAQNVLIKLHDQVDEFHQREVLGRLNPTSQNKEVVNFLVDGILKSNKVSKDQTQIAIDSLVLMEITEGTSLNKSKIYSRLPSSQQEEYKKAYKRVFNMNISHSHDHSDHDHQ